jgi:hypothetical protein
MNNLLIIVKKIKFTSQMQFNVIENNDDFSRIFDIVKLQNLLFFKEIFSYNSRLIFNGIKWLNLAIL